MIVKRGFAVMLPLAFVVIGGSSCIPARPLPLVEEGSTGDPTETTGGVDADPSIGPMGTTTDPTEVDGPGTGDTGPVVETTDTSTEPSCGNGAVDSGEDCDGTDLAGKTCEGLSFDGGMLACGEDCSFDTSGCGDLPDAPVLTLSFSQIKRFDFSWGAVDGASYYQLLEIPSPGEPQMQLGGDITGESISIAMPLHFRFEASYTLRACDPVGLCAESASASVMSSLAEAVGYFKGANTGANDSFGDSVALSGDGNTLAVGASQEDSDAVGIDNPDQGDFAGNYNAGAVYVFVLDGLDWSQQAYVKASNTGSGDQFGISVALSDDGNTLAVGAEGEGAGRGAVYVFARDPMALWSEQAYLTASNDEPGDSFGNAIALSGDGNTLAVGALDEDSNDLGTIGVGADNAAIDAGAVYVFIRDPMDAWPQQAYIKASNTGANDLFGCSVALSNDGNTLAVGAYQEDSSATEIGGPQLGGAADSGAAYVFFRDGVWSQQAYVKASNTGAGDFFGFSVALRGDGNTLVVGAHGEDSNAVGVGGIGADNNAIDAGAAYVYERDGMGDWTFQTYVKASNTDTLDEFGRMVSLNDHGDSLAVGARQEDSSEVGVNGRNQADNGISASGAVYVFKNDELLGWSQRAYVKASNTGLTDHFGECVAFNGDGNTLVVGARLENGGSTGIDGDQNNDSANNAGAVYLY